MSGTRGNFFAVDRRTWARVCSLGLNAAVAYLVLARGTGPDNRTTEWSTHAIEKYTNISRPKAKSAIGALQSNGLLEVVRGGQHPQYRLVPEHELAPLTLTDFERSAIENLRCGKPVFDIELCSASAAVGRGAGFVGEVYMTGTEFDAQPQWIWLPNEIVDGAGAETPPVELVRQMQDVMTLRLLIDFYYAHDLCTDGGIAREVTYRTYSRHPGHQKAQFTIWIFGYPKQTMSWCDVSLPHFRSALTPEEIEAGIKNTIDFFDRCGRLADAGLVEWVPSLFENGGCAGELIHPCGSGFSDRLEDRLGQALRQAACALIGQAQFKDWLAAGMSHVVPIARHIANVHLLDILRLRYRPKTGKTAAWLAESNKTGERMISQYQQITSRYAEQAAAPSAISKETQGISR